MVKITEHAFFTKRDLIVEGPRVAAETAARMIEYLYPTARRNYAVHDVVTGDWRVGLELPA